MKRVLESVEYEGCGLPDVWLDNWPVHKCPGCAIRLPELPNAEDAASEIARRLVLRRSKLDADSILFLRKTMGFTAQALADLLKVGRVEVSRWENEKAEISPHVEYRLRLVVIDRVIPPEMRSESKGAVYDIVEHGYGPVGGPIRLSRDPRGQIRLLEQSVSHFAPV
jgi:DNA-binding transcriptional regulator YiaG